MTQQELDALKALAAKATPGPWESSHSIDPPSNDDYHPDNPNREGWSEGPIVTGVYRDVKAQVEADARYIAAACNAAPALVAEVERLTARVAELEIALEAEEFARERRMDNLDPA